MDDITRDELGRLSGVAPLDPHEVIDGDSGIVEIDAKGDVIRAIDPAGDPANADAIDAKIAADRLAELGELTHYRVRWIIDIYASTPKEAAAKALMTQRKPASIATVFDVWPHGTPEVANQPIDFETIDLMPEHSTEG